jgi:hypothetical protein
MSDNKQDNRQNSQPAPYSDVLEGILTKLEAYFTGMMESIFSHADKYVFDEFTNAQSIADRNHMREFMQSLRKQRPAIEKRFLMELNQYLKPVAVCKKLPSKKKDADDVSGLSLMSADETEELVTLTTIGGKAAADFREELTHLEIRLDFLATINRNIFHAKALDPHNLCESLRETLTYTDFQIRDKLILYKFFGEELLKTGKKLYRELNELMMNAGVMPRIELAGKYPHRRAQELPQEQPSGGYSAEQTRGPLGRGGQAGGYYSSASAGTPTGGAAAGHATGSGGGGGGHHAPAQGAGAAPMQAHAAGQGMPHIPGGGRPGSAADVNAARISAGMPVSHIQQSIQGFVGGDPVTADTAGGVGGAAAYYTRQDVVSALSSLQAAVEIVHDMPLQFDAAAIKKAVLSTIGEKEGGTVTKRVNQISEKTVDFIKLIFDAIIEDKSITDTIKALLLSLQIPIIKAAMLDADFFIDDKHAARQLLDKIAEAGVGVSEHKDPVYIEIRDIVKKLLQDYSENIEAFAAALEAIRVLTERIYTEAREREKKTQQEVKHAHARNVVLQEIRKITLGKELPHNIRLLVLKIWPSLMFNHYLRFGKANDEWVELLMILTKVIDTVQPSRTLEDLAEIGLSHEDIIYSVNEKLKKSRKPDDVISQTIADLRAAYDNLPKRPAPAAKPVEIEAARVAEPEVAPEQADVPAAGAVQPPTAVAEVAPAVPVAETEATHLAVEPEKETATEEEEIEEQIKPEEVARLKLAMLSSDVQPGAWFIVYNGEGRPVRRLKLAVILMQDATLVFVDHLGNVVIEKDAEDFSHELERGQSSVIMQHSVFDHALRSALNTIER